MSLIDDLRQIPRLSPSHVPTLHELAEMVGRLVAYVEHGDKLLDAAADDAKAIDAGEPSNNVNELLAPPPEESDQSAGAAVGTGSMPAPVPPPAPAAAPPPSDAPPDTRDAQIAALEQQLETLRAQQQRTQVSVEPAPDRPVV